MRIDDLLQMTEPQLWRDLPFSLTAGRVMLLVRQPGKISIFKKSNYQELSYYSCITLRSWRYLLFQGWTSAVTRQETFSITVWVSERTLGGQDRRNRRVSHSERTSAASSKGKGQLWFLSNSLLTLGNCLSFSDTFACPHWHKHQSPIVTSGAGC